ncbi:MAG: hypothetical protein AAB403_23005 [Planctomycetota bacterium]
MTKTMNIVLLATSLLTGCSGRDASVVVRNAEDLRKAAASLIASPVRGKLDPAQYPEPITRVKPREVYVDDRVVRLMTDGWNPSNGFLIGPDTNLVAGAEVAWNGRLEKQVAPGIVRFEYGPKPMK